VDTEVHAPSSNLLSLLAASYFQVSIFKSEKRCVFCHRYREKNDMLHYLEDFHKVAYQL